MRFPALIITWFRIEGKIFAHRKKKFREKWKGVFASGTEKRLTARAALAIIWVLKTRYTGSAKRRRSHGF